MIFGRFEPLGVGEGSFQLRFPYEHGAVFFKRTFVVKGVLYISEIPLVAFARLERNCQIFG